MGLLVVLNVEFGDSSLVDDSVDGGCEIALLKAYTVKGKISVSLLQQMMALILL
jgi:hypothetical protein